MGGDGFSAGEEVGEGAAGGGAGGEGEGGGGVDWRGEGRVVGVGLAEGGAEGGGSAEELEWCHGRRLLVEECEERGDARPWLCHSCPGPGVGGGVVDVIFSCGRLPALHAKRSSLSLDKLFGTVTVGIA